MEIKQDERLALIRVALVIAILSGVVSLALSYYGVHALVAGPFCSILGVFAFLQIFPVSQLESKGAEPFVSPAEQTSPSLSELDGAFEAGILAILESGLESRLVVGPDLKVIGCTKQTSLLDSKLACGQDLRRLQQYKPLANSILEALEAFNSGNSALLDWEAEWESGGDRCNCQVKSLLNPQSGEIYFLVNLVDRLSLQARSLNEPDFIKFCCTLAHDLNNLFGGLETSLALLRKQTQASLTERQIKLLSNLGQIAASGGRLSSDLLNFGNNARATVDKTSINLKQVTDEVLSLIEGDTRLQGVRLNIAVTQELWVSATPTGLHQVLINLLYNSIDALAGKGELSVVTQAADQRVFLEVSDNGCGMSEKTLAEIFEPFFTTKKNSPKGKYIGGSGLGLTNVKALIESWGGKISCQSKEGVGTVFYIELHRAQPVETIMGLH